MFKFHLTTSLPGGYRYTKGGHTYKITAVDLREYIVTKRISSCGISLYGGVLLYFVFYSYDYCCFLQFMDTRTPSWYDVGLSDMIAVPTKHSTWNSKHNCQHERPSPNRSRYVRYFGSIPHQPRSSWMETIRCMADNAQSWQDQHILHRYLQCTLLKVTPMGWNSLAANVPISQTVTQCSRPYQGSAVHGSATVCFRIIRQCCDGRSIDVTTRKIAYYEVVGFSEPFFVHVA